MMWKVSRAELKARILERIGDRSNQERVYATALRIARDARPPLDCLPLFEIGNAEEFLTYGASLFGEISLELGDEIRAAFAVGLPMPFIVHRCVVGMGDRSRSFIGVWWPSSVAELLASDETSFGAMLYRSLYWREPSDSELEYVDRSIASGISRRDVIALVADRPGRHRFGLLSGMIDLGPLAHLETADFIARIYVMILGRAPTADEIGSWNTLINRGTSRGEVARRFMREAEATSPGTLCIGLPTRSRASARLLGKL